MKVSLNWIKDYVKLPEDMDLPRLAYDLTMSTVEVEGAEDLAKRFEHMLVGVVTEVCPHPNADKLRICKTEMCIRDRDSDDRHTMQCMMDTITDVAEDVNVRRRERGKGRPEDILRASLFYLRISRCPDNSSPEPAAARPDPPCR